MSYSARAIKWVKNVKRDNGSAWAFMEETEKDSFVLTFSKTQRKGAMEVKPGEIILLFQRVDKIPGTQKETYLSHLVTPIYSIDDPQGCVDIDHPNFNWGRKVKVVARATNATDIYTAPIVLNFYKANWGKICPISLLNSKKSEAEIQDEVWRLFDGHYHVDAEVNYDYVDFYEFEGSAIEAIERKILREHKIRERDPNIVKRAKARAMRNGRILCECCSFDFRSVYGKLGDGFIECHHIQPIAKGGVRETKMEDLAMVCSNCHRMLHRKTEAGTYLTVGELSALIAQKRMGSC